MPIDLYYSNPFFLNRVMLISIPIIPTIKNITAMPEPLSEPKILESAFCNGDLVLINGSKT